MISNFNPGQGVVGGSGIPLTQGVVGPTGTFTGMLDALTVGQYNATPIVLANGQVAVVQLDPNGYLKVVEQQQPGAEDNTNGIYLEVIRPLAVSTYCKSQSTNNGAANATNVKATAGNLFSINCYNDNANTRYLFFVNTAGTPTGASASLLCPLSVASKTQVILGEDFFGTQGLNFSTGIGIAFMTTIAGGTLGTAGECFWTATFK